MAITTDTNLVTGAALLFLVGSLALWLWAWRQLARRQRHGGAVTLGSFTLLVGVLLLALGGDPAYLPLIGLSLSLLILGVWRAVADDLPPAPPTGVTPPTPVRPVQRVALATKIKSN